MHPTLDPLWTLAFHRAPASDANEAIAAARAEAGGDAPFSYEVVVGADQTLPELAAQVLPRLVYHLESRGAHLPACEGVFLTLFAGESLAFVHARDALPLLADAVGLTPAELSARFGTGELRRALRPGEVVPEPTREPLRVPDRER